MEFSSAPKVSICIPTYKQVEYLRRTLDSVKAQTFSDFEIVITDDSPDHSVENLIKEYDFRSRLKFFKNKISLGTPENWNEAVRKASGQYIKILHHDDYFTDENSLLRYVQLLDENPQSDFGFSGTSIWNISKNRKYHYYASKSTLEQIRLSPEFLFHCNWVGAPSATIYRSSIKSSYDPNLKWLVDIDFYIRALKENSNFAYTPKALITTPKGVSHQVTEGCKNDRDVELREYFYLFDKMQSSKYYSSDFINTLAKLFVKYDVDEIGQLKDLNLNVDKLFTDKIIRASKNPLNRVAFKIEKFKKILF